MPPPPPPPPPPSSKNDDEDRSRLFDEIKNFSQRKLKKVETKVVTGSGEQLTEKRSPKGLQVSKLPDKTTGYVVDHKPDLQVGMIIPGLLISSQDVAQDKSLLETYEVTHILNLAPGVPNSFEDDYNYKKLEILDVPETDIKQYFDECIEFITEGIQRGNCLVHCNAGVSRSTTLCCAYLMKIKKMKYKEALAAVREARAFAKPNDGFAKQLEEYDDQLFGQMAPPDSTEDKFMARKRAEIEAEKAAISGTSSVKNKLKTFGAQLESVYASKLQALSPLKLPLKKKPANETPAKPANRKKSIQINSNAPPPPPPPPMDLLNDSLAPPPPPPASIYNDTAPAKSTPKKQAGIRKSSKPFVNDVVNNHDVQEPEVPKALSKHVDETPIKVSAQKKLWEQAHSQQETQNHVNKTLKKSVKAAPKTVEPEPPQVQPQPIVAKPVNTNKPTRTNKLATYEKCEPASSPLNQSPAASVTASPEPKKKIIIKKSKDANNNDITSSPVMPRRATRDLSSVIDASSTNNSQTSSPFASPATQRKQMHYGRRTSTQPIQQQPVEPQPRKPTWGLRDQVDNLLDSTPSVTPTRSRSPVVGLQQNSRDNSPASNKMVFGRVPPRKGSITGTTLNNNTTNNSDLPTVSAPSTIISTNKKSTPISNATATSTPTPAAKVTSTEKSNDKFNKELKEEATPKPLTKSNQIKDEKEDVRTGFKKTPLVETKEKPINRSIEARRKSKGLNRSSTAEILKLIKTKSKADFGKSMETVDEDVEIEFLLNQLDENGLENIDWKEIGLDEQEVQDIVDKNQDENDDDVDSDDDDDDDDDDDLESDSDDSDSDDDDDMEHTVIKPIAPSIASNKNPMAQPKVKSTATLTLKPVQNLEISESESD